MIKKIALDNNHEWDKIVKSFSKYDVHYLSSYSKAFISDEGVKPVLIYFENGLTRAINVILIRDIGLSDKFIGRLEVGEWFDISTPYGYGGFIIEGNDFQNLENEYVSFCKFNGYISEFTRFNLFSNYKDIFTGKLETNTLNVVKNLDGDFESLIMDCEHKVRKNIKKAAKFGLKIEIDTTGERYSDFLRIYHDTMDRNNASSNFYFNKSFFEMINTMKGNFAYFYVLYEDEIISTELILVDNEKCYSFLGGTLSDYFDCRPNDFLKAEIIRWANQQEIKNFVLGGGYGENDGIFRYKKSFSPRGLYSYYIGKRIFNDEKYKFLLQFNDETSREKIDNGFFPEYRV